VVVDDALSLLGRGLAAQDAEAQSVRHGQQAEGLRVRVQVCGRVASGLGRPQLGADHVDHGVRVLDQRADRQRRVGQREREVGRVEHGEGAPLVVGGQCLGQDGADDVTRAGPAACLLDPPDPRHRPLAESDCQVLHPGQEELFLGAEVVLHQPQGHPGLGRDLAHPGGVQPARGGGPQQRVRDLPPPLLVIDPSRHRLTVPSLLSRLVNDTLVS
jgi:hypothetical protein